MIIIEQLIIDESVLRESAPAIIYHTTDMRSVKQIITSNQFNLTSRFSSSSDNVISKKNFYLSTSTSKASGYRAGRSAQHTVLVLDGNKFNQRYQAKPVDYWGPKWRGGILTSDMHPVDKKHSYETSDEQEIRIYSDKAIIANARDYILEIHYMAPNMDESTLTEPEKEIYKGTNVSYGQYFACRPILQSITSYEIPIYVYGTEKDFKILDKRKALKYDTFRESKDSILHHLMVFADYPNWKEHTDEIDKIERNGLESYLRGSEWYLSDLSIQLSNNLHNVKGGDYSPNYIKELNKLSMLTKKYKSNTILDFLQKFQKDHIKKD